MIADFLSHNLLLFIIATITSVEILFYAQQMLTDYRDFTVGKKIVCGALNGFILLSILMMEGDIKDIILLIGCPMILCVELMIFTKDKWTSYLFVYVKLAINFMSVFWIIAAVAATRSQLPGYSRVIMAFTLIIVGSLGLFLGKHKQYPMYELRLMVHDWKIGKLFFIYLALGDIFLGTSSILLSPFLQSIMIAGPAKTIIALELLLKTVAIWGFSYVLLYLRTKEIRTNREFEQIKNNLDTEKRFRSTVQRKGMMNAQINVNTGVLKDGKEYFLEKSWIQQKDFENTFKLIAKKMVHPRDQEDFLKNNTPQMILERLETTPYYSQQIRVAPKEVIKYFYLAEPFRKAYEKSEKPWMWIKIDYIYTRDITTNDISLFMVVFDVDEQVEMKEKLHISATTDALTGLLNRTIMQYEIEKKLQDTNQSGTMILLDVDNFKNINDKLGHPIGDEVLIRFSNLLHELFRRNDVIGRLGGDEFAVFIPGLLSRAALEEKIKEVNKRAIFSYVSETGETVRTSASIGIVTSGQNDTYETLYKKADEALYTSKKKGKNTYTFYENKH